MGIRPEHLRVATPPGDDRAMFRAQCDLVEFLGHQVLVHVRVGDIELRAFEDPAKRIRTGDIVDCSISLDRLHLFDSRTGQALVARASWPRLTS